MARYLKYTEVSDEDATADLGHVNCTHYYNQNLIYTSIETDFCPIVANSKN